MQHELRGEIRGLWGALNGALVTRSSTAFMVHLQDVHGMRSSGAIDHIEGLEQQTAAQWTSTYSPLYHNQRVNAVFRA